MSEVKWADINGYEGIYIINSNGEVFSLPRYSTKCGRKSGKQIVTPIGRAGYRRVSLKKNGNQSTHFLHRLIAVAFIPNPENKPCVNHKNSIRTDNSISNLEWCTHSENNSHAHKFGNQKNYYGEKHPQRILTWLKVSEIRTKYKKGVYTITMLSVEYSVSRTSLFSVIKNKTWQRKK